MDQDGWTNGEIVRTLQRIEAAQKATNGRLDTLAAGFVARAEWEVRKEHIDDRLNSIQSEITALKKAEEGRRLPWPSVVAAIAAVVSLAILIVNYVAT